jgi:hypothetical protein
MGSAIRIKRFLLDLVSFNTPQANVINFGGLLFLLAFIPTEKLYYLPVRSVYETIFGVTPYSSGILRGLSRLLHGDVQGAIAFNQLTLLVFVVILLLLFLNIRLWMTMYRKTGKLFS